MKTVSELLKQAMSAMGEDEKYKKDYMPFVVDLTNQLLTDCFHTNNAVRQTKGMEPLSVIPWVGTSDEELAYEDNVVAGVMAYGLAYWLLVQDDEYDKANAFNAAYETGKTMLSAAVYTDVEDAYR